MPSWQATILNRCLRYLVKPMLSYNFKKYLKTKNVVILHQMRALMEKFPVLLPPNAQQKSLVLNKVPVLEIYAKNMSPTKTMIYLHGGGYIAGSPLLYRELAYRLAVTCNAKVWLVDYRLAPEHKFPAAIEDVLAVYQWYIDHSISTEPLFLAGDSAGGGLALSTLIALRDQQLPLPNGAICLSPWTDLALTGESLQKNNNTDALLFAPSCQLYAEESQTRDPLVSPLYADLHHLPPLLIQVSDSEILLDDAVRFANKAKQAGTHVELEIWQTMPHVWPIFARFLPEGQRAIASIGNFANSLSQAY